MRSQCIILTALSVEGLVEQITFKSFSHSIGYRFTMSKPEGNCCLYI